MPGEIPSTPIKVDLPPEPTNVEPAAEPSVTSTPPDVAADPDAGSTPEGGEKKPEKPATDAETAYMRTLRKRDDKITRRERENGERHATLTSREEAVKSKESSFAEREAKLIEREKLIDEDPLAYASKHKGWREEDLARRFLNGAKPSTQELEHRAKQERDAETGALKTQIDELKKMLDEAVIAPKRAEAQKQSDAKHRADYVKVASDATKYPSLANAIARDPEGTTDLAESIATKVIADANAGRTQPLRSIPELHHRISVELNARFAKILGAPTAPAAPTGDTKGTEKPGQQGQEADPKVAPTLSGKGASQRTTIAKSDDIVALEIEDPERARKEAIAAIKKAKAA